MFYKIRELRQAGFSDTRSHRLRPATFSSLVCAWVRVTTRARARARVTRARLDNAFKK